MNVPRTINPNRADIADAICNFKRDFNLDNIMVIHYQSTI
jgi:hypothetical protein